MASENTSGVNEDRMGLDDSELENEEYYSQRTYDRQLEGTDHSQNLVSRGSSNITHETDRMAATYLLQLRERDTQNQTDQAPAVSNSSRYQHVVPPGNSNANPSPTIAYRHVKCQFGQSKSFRSTRYDAF